MTSKPHPGSDTKRWRPRFHLDTLMLVFLVCSVTAAAGRYLVQALAGDGVSRVHFVMAVLLLPVILLMVASAVRRLLLVLKSRPRR